MLSLVAVAVGLLAPPRADLLTRRQAVHALCLSSGFALPGSANAAKDCMLDCEENCNRVAPASTRYCYNSCVDYCAQGDRQDGLSGSVNSEAAEVGWASAVDPSRFLPGAAPKAVPYGEDRPPALPDIFGVNDIFETRGHRQLGRGGWRPSERRGAGRQTDRETHGQSRGRPDMGMEVFPLRNQSGRQIDR